MHDPCTLQYSTKKQDACIDHKVQQTPKFKRVSLNETPEFPFWGLGNCVDFDLRN